MATAQRLGKALGITDRMDVLGEQEAVIPLLSVSDLFLLPSAQESFGLAALEAMACEVPVVASAVGGLPEVIVHGDSGFLHPPEDLEAMAESAVALLTTRRSTSARPPPPCNASTRCSAPRAWSRCTRRTTAR